MCRPVGAKPARPLPLVPEDHSKEKRSDAPLLTLALIIDEAAGAYQVPYLLRDLAIDRVNQVWSADITYIRLARGFVSLVAILDWFSRYVLAWALSITQETAFCLQALRAALQGGRPEIFNIDQGGQFTSRDFTATLLDAEIRISMDGAVERSTTCL